MTAQPVDQPLGQPQVQPGGFSYFEPQHYATARPRELDGDSSPHPVVVVGAGPVGLVAALDLARRGVRATVIELDDKVSLGSRALALSYRSLEILGGLGVVDRFIKDGVHWRSGRSFYRDTEISSFEIPQSADAQYPALLNLQQPFIESYLVEACLESGLVEFRWSTRCTGIESRADGAVLELEVQGEAYQLNADWVIAADGARSVLRDALGMKLHGTSYSNMFVIVDVKMASERSAERLCWFSPPAFPDSTVLLHKQPHDIWRIDYQVPADTDPAVATSVESVLPKVRQHLEWIGETAAWDIEWVSLYRAHALTLPHYRQDRVLFVGDAAHLLPIFGVRGMNSGLADAANLSWKLASVVQGTAGEDLLDSYDVEQREAFDQNSSFAHLSTLFMTPGTRGSLLVRDAALDLALLSEDFQALADPRYSTPLDYHHGPLVTPDADGDTWDGGIVAGGLLPNRIVEPLTGGQGFVNDLMGRGWALLAFEPRSDQFVERDGLAVLPLASSSPLGVLLDAAPGSCYLLRPDRHVLARRRDWNDAVVHDLLALHTATERN